MKFRDASDAFEETYYDHEPFYCDECNGMDDHHPNCPNADDPEINAVLREFQHRRKA